MREEAQACKEGRCHYKEGEVIMLRRLVPVLVGAAVSLLVLAAPALAEFGIEDFSGSIINQAGSPDTQAGSHPYEVTITTDFNNEVNPEDTVYPDGNVKNITVNLPVGLVGDPTGIGQCPQQDLVSKSEPFLGSECPLDSQVGQLAVDTLFLGSVTVPLYNMVPRPGEPAQLAANVGGFDIAIDTHVRSGSDYGLTATLSDITNEVPLISTTLTVWGVPADPAHDEARGAACAAGECLGGGHAAGTLPRPFLTLPTACVGPQEATISTDSWEHPGDFVTASTFLDHDSSDNPLGNDGCNRLDFNPSLSVAPESSVVDSPTGVDVDLHVPPAGLQDPEGLAEANLRNAVVALPAGMRLNPSVAGGLAACSPAQIALSSPEPASCPDGAKIGTVEVDTPILSHPLDGGVYVAEQGNNPFGSLLAIYLAVADPETGVVLKLAGHVVADPVTGQLTTTFMENPRLPFSDLKLDFFGGPRGVLVNPDSCGSYTATSALTPWSSETPAEPSSAFEINEGCHGALFNPSFSAGTTSNQAGAFGPLSVTFSRTDQEEGLGAITLKTPPGLLGVLKSVPLCPEPQAAQGTCGAGSLIGHTTVLGGAGPDPVSVTGQVFLTGPYKGAPFGLSIVVPAAVGPFDLGTVVVRAAINVDPATTALTVTSDALPTILQGIPLQIKTVNVTVDRTGFMFNPTSCEPLTIAGTLTSTQGAQAQLSSRFQAAGCTGLPFKPSFTVSTQAATSKKQGASLDVKVAYPAGSANIHSVAVTLPKQLPARLSTIQQACPQATFAANPASCPAGSQIGTGTAITPILANPVTGPAYLVSHGGASFPDLVVILQGEGITLNLVGSIDIKHNITSSTFASVPDAPISSFELKLPEGPHSGLAAVLPAKAKGSMCSQALTMPTTLTGQNGAVIKQTTKITITGCTKAKKKSKPKKHAKGKKK